MASLLSRRASPFLLLAAFLTVGGQAQAESGERLFQRKCAGCHGPTAEGRGSFPNLVGKTADDVRKRVRNPSARHAPLLDQQPARRRPRQDRQLGRGPE